MQQGAQHVTSNNCWELLANNVASVHWRIQGRGSDPPPPPRLPHLIQDQTEARRTENCFFEAGSPLSQGLDDRAPPLPGGLYPTLQFAWDLTSIVDVHSRNLYFPKNKSRVKNVFLRPPTIQ